ncbi:MAG: MBL fold metallo-hydrolase [Pseudomonadota bacterium]
MTDRIVLLGTKGGPAIRPGGAMPTSSLLQLAGLNIVVDCGLGVARSLVEAGVALPKIDAVFITHLHSDHVLELGPLLHTAWTTGLKRPIPVFGPVGTTVYMRHFLASMAFDNTIRVEDEGRIPLNDLVSVTEYDEGALPPLSGIGVDALRVDHPPVTDCFALRFSHSGRRVVFSADTAYFPPLAEFAHRADVLVHEAMLPEGVDRLVARTGNAARLKQHLHASHCTVADAAKIAKDADVGHLCLNHLIPADDPEITAEDFERQARTIWQGSLTIGDDGVEIPIGGSTD